MGLIGQLRTAGWWLTAAREAEERFHERAYRALLLDEPLAALPATLSEERPPEPAKTLRAA